MGVEETEIDGRRAYSFYKARELLNAASGDVHNILNSHGVQRFPDGFVDADDVDRVVQEATDGRRVYRNREIKELLGCPPGSLGMHIKRSGARKYLVGYDAEDFDRYVDELMASGWRPRPKPAPVADRTKAEKPEPQKKPLKSDNGRRDYIKQALSELAIVPDEIPVDPSTRPEAPVTDEIKTVSPTAPSADKNKPVEEPIITPEPRDAKPEDVDPTAQIRFGSVTSLLGISDDHLGSLMKQGKIIPTNRLKPFQSRSTLLFDRKDVMRIKAEIIGEQTGRKVYTSYDVAEKYQVPMDDVSNVVRSPTVKTYWPGIYDAEDVDSLLERRRRRESDRLSLQTAPSEAPRRVGQNYILDLSAFSAALIREPHRLVLPDDDSRYVPIEDVESGFGYVFEDVSPILAREGLHVDPQRGIKESHIIAFIDQVVHRMNPEVANRLRVSFGYMHGKLTGLAGDQPPYF